jgi:hypothetical protein
MKPNLLVFALKRYLIVKVILADNFNVRKNNLLNLEKLKKTEQDEINNIYLIYKWLYVNILLDITKENIIEFDPRDDYEKELLTTNEKGRVTNIQFFDPTKINNDTVEYKLPEIGSTTKEEVDDFFSKSSKETIQKEKRAKADEEFVALSQKYKDDTERKKGLKHMKNL